MSLDGLYLRFQGFHPSEFTRSYIETSMDELHEESPVGSVLRASFNRNGADIKAVVRITSPAGHFFASAKGTQVKDVNRQIVHQIRRQLDKWQTVRAAGRHHRQMALPAQEETTSVF